MENTRGIWTVNQSDFSVMFMSCLYHRKIIGYEYLDDHILQTAKRLRRENEVTATWNCDTFTTSKGVYDLKDDHKMAPLLNEFEIQIDHVPDRWHRTRGLGGHSRAPLPREHQQRRAAALPRRRKVTTGRPPCSRKWGGAFCSDWS